MVAYEPIDKSTKELMETFEPIEKGLMGTYEPIDRPTNELMETNED